MSDAILVVEDERSLRVILCDNLRFDGFTVHAAASGREALELAAKERPRLAILDVGLPDIDGWEVARRLESDPATRDVAVILLSGNFGDEINGAEERPGRRHFVAKPYEYSALLVLIRDILKKA